LRINVSWTPRDLSEWGALGALVGRLAGDYWEVPIVCGIDRIPFSDELKHFGAAAGSYGSLAMYHLAGITPESEIAVGQTSKIQKDRTYEIELDDLRAFQQHYLKALDTVDLVVFSAPQLGLIEIQAVAHLLDGRCADIPLLVITSPQIKPDADRLGLTAKIESAGGTVLSGMCFYQSYAREIAKVNNWKRLATSSAKLVNILEGYGYQPALLSMETCISIACNGGRHDFRSAFRSRIQSDRRSVSGERWILRSLRPRSRARHFLSAGPRSCRSDLHRPSSNPRCCQGRRCFGLDVARDGGAWRRAARACSQSGQPDHGSGGSSCRDDSDVGIRRRRHYRSFERSNR
jgi:hypothetical protein